jgi:two-component system, NarL family, sensor histidine kinase UhpB
LTNALRHAQPSRVDIAVDSGAGRIQVSVADDGVGLPADWARPGRYGLRGLADRVAQLGGTLSVDNRPARGMLLSADIPLTVAG